jgi:serine/threonine protein kinase
MMSSLAATTGTPTSRGFAEWPARTADVLAAAGYRLERLLGRGRTARVYQACDRCGCRVAVKLVEPVGADNGPVRQLAHEHALLSRLRDRRVVRVREHRVLRDVAFLAMDYVPGGSLRERLCKPLPPAHAVRWLGQAAAAAAAAHRAGIVHRDLKPANLIVRCDGTLVLADFGIAAPSGQASGAASPGTLVGTTAYAAPEQLQGAEPAPAADVYSLGALFHELLCGRPPYVGATPLEVMAQQLVAPVPRLPSPLARYQPLLERLLEKRPQHRPRDGAAVLHQIQGLAAAAGAPAIG